MLRDTESVAPGLISSWVQSPNLQKPWLTSLTLDLLRVRPDHSPQNAGDFRGGPVVKSLPTNAGDMGSVPGLGRSHVPWATKPVYHNYWTHTLEPVSCNCWAWALQLESSPHSPQLKKAWAQQQKIKKRKRTLGCESLGKVESSYRILFLWGCWGAGGAGGEHQAPLRC